MPFERTLPLSLGTSQTGLTDLRAQLVTAAGVDSGMPITTGFFELGRGLYGWDYAAFTDNFRGFVRFYSNAAPTVPLALGAVNPEGEAENADVKTSTRLATGTVAADITATLGFVDELESRLTALRAANLDNLDAAVSTRLSTAGYTAPANATIAAIAGFVDAAVSSRATPAQVAAAIVTALTVTTYPEPTGMPDDTTTLEQKLSMLFMALRNKIRETDTTQEIWNDIEDTPIATAVTSEVMGEFIRGKFTS